MSKHGKVDQRSVQSGGMWDSAGTWHVQRAQASRVGKATENCKNSLFRAQRENRHINAKDMSSTHPCVVVSARDEGMFVSCPSLL